MFSFSQKSVLMLLACACATSDTFDDSLPNDTDILETAAFIISTHPRIEVHYFPLPKELTVPVPVSTPNMFIFSERLGKPYMFNASKSELELNVTIATQWQISEKARQFLTGSLSTILIPSFYTLICLFSLPINICVVVAFGLRIRLKKPASIYMLNLACADLLFAALLPFKISYHFGGNHWMFGPVMCRVVTAAFYWNMYCSVLLIACISVDRLLAVVYPIDSLPWRTPCSAIVICVTMWILSFASIVPIILSDQTFHLRQLNITTCHDVKTLFDIIRFYKTYYIVLCCAFFFLPLLVTVVSYARVIWSLSRVPRKVLGRSQRRTRAVVMCVTVLVIFVLCFTPTNVLLMAHYLKFNEGAESIEETSSYAACQLSMCLGSLNVLLDPLVYYFGSSQCRKQLSSMLRCESVSGGSGGHSQSCLIKL